MRSAVSVAMRSFCSSVGLLTKETSARNSRHRSLGEDDVRRLFHAAIAQSRILHRQSPIKRPLHAGCESPRLLNFFVQFSR